jgi:hypothetical protein
VQQYNNDLPPEILASFDKPALGDEPVARMLQEFQRRGISAAKGFLVDNFEVDKMLAAETAH